MNIATIILSNQNFLKSFILVLGSIFVLSFLATIPFIITVIFVALLIRSLLCFFKEEGSLECFVVALFLVGGIVAVLNLIISNFTAPYYAWSAIRLTWPASILNGYDFYSVDNGFILGRMYGPVLPLTHLLSASLNNYAFSVHAGSLMSSLWYFLPTMFIFMQRARLQHHAYVLSASYMCVFMLLTFISPPLRRAAFAIHADAPSLGFGVLACLIFAKQGPLAMKDLVISSIFVTLAFWSKQTAIFLVFALPIYVSFFYNKKVLRDYLLCLLLSGMASTLLAGIIFGFYNLFYNMFFIPYQQPSVFGWGDWSEGMTMAIRCLFDGLRAQIALIISLLSVYFLSRRREKDLSIFGWKKENLWPLFFIIGSCMAPISILGIMKVGGDVNGLSPSIFYWSVAAAVLLVDLYRLASAQDHYLRRCMLWVTAVMLLSVLNVAVWKTAQDFRRIVNLSPHKISAEVLEFLRSHQREVYFPFHTFEHSLIERRIYHNFDGLFDWHYARVPIGPDRLYAFLPANMKYIACDISLVDSFTNYRPPRVSANDREFLKLLRKNDVPSLIIRKVLGMTAGDLDRISLKELADAINKILRMRDFHKQINARQYEDFLKDEDRNMLAKAQSQESSLREQDYIKLNRALLEAIYQVKIQRGFNFIEQYFPEFNRRISLPDLPNFIIFVKESTYNDYRKGLSLTEIK